LLPSGTSWFPLADGDPRSAEPIGRVRMVTARPGEGDRLATVCPRRTLGTRDGPIPRKPRVRLAPV